MIEVKSMSKADYFICHRNW